MITFERVTEENLYIAKEMMDSNSLYFEKEHGKSEFKELKSLTLNGSNFLIKVDDTYIGLISYREENERQLVSINLLIIHADYQGFGYGTTVYWELEDLFIKQGYKKITLSVRNEDNRVKLFWERNGYMVIEGDVANGAERVQYEKYLIQ